MSIDIDGYALTCFAVSGTLLNTVVPVTHQQSPVAAYGSRPRPDLCDKASVGKNK